MDNYDAHRKEMAAFSALTTEYCGLPVSISDERLVLAPGHPAESIYCPPLEQEDPRLEGCTIINQWYSMERRCQIVIWRTPEGVLTWSMIPGIHHFAMDMRTMGCSIAWSIEAEEKAQRMLRRIIPEHLFKMYLLTGIFPETSPRSQIVYFFRRLRPTVAASFRKDPGGSILCCLCGHGIGYYAGTWAGALCPTDDVIAALLLMRADEHFFWRRYNQIPAWQPEAGL